MTEKAMGDSSGKTTNVSEYIDDISRHIKEADIYEKQKERPQEYEWYYRGENEQYDTTLIPTLLREQKLRDKESQMLVELITHQPEDFLKYSSIISRWCLAQHYQLPTRLLDITKNPLVALYFACTSNKEDGSVYAFKVPYSMIKSFNSDSISVVSNFARLKKCDQDCLIEKVKGEHPDYEITTEDGDAAKRLYGLIREEKPGFSERIQARDLFRIFVVNPLMSFDRVRTQMGAFLVSAFPHSYERNMLTNHPMRISISFEKEGVGRAIWQEIMEDIYVIDMTLVSVKHKHEILEQLNRIGFANETLFPTLDRFTRAISQKYM